MKYIQSNEPKPTTIRTYDEVYFECICKNIADNSGFEPCDTQGNAVEPTYQDWTTDWYVCNDCGRMIDQGTLRVVGYAKENRLTPEERREIDEEIKRFGLPEQTE